MITAYQVRASFRGEYLSASQIYYLNRGSAEAHADSSNKFESERHDVNDQIVYRVVECRIDHMWMSVEIPFITSSGRHKIREVARMARKLRKIDGIITGEVTDHYRTMIVEKRPDSVVWKCLGEKIR